MKAKANLPAALAAFMVLGFSAASAQEACNNEYSACMTQCASRMVKAGQETCFSNCESKNNYCFEQVYGRRPANAGAANAQATAPAKDAMAKDAPARAEQQEPAAEREPAPPPQQRPRR